MYNFIDVNETSEGFALPSEALQINGEYIENLIPGYRTLNVTGREALSPELTTFETGVRDGSTLRSRRFPARIITVKYQIISDTNEAFREAYNKLAGILNVENAQLIFNDEQDKFFTGTPSAIQPVKPGLNSVIGEFELFCADPFKYSVVEYEAEPALDNSGILIDYNGTYKAYPILEADFNSENEISEDGETVQPLTGSGDCGFVAFFNEEEKIIQLGDPDETNSATYAKSQTLINQSFENQLAWGSAAQSLWVLNGGKVLPNTVQQAGAIAMGALTYAQAENLTTTGKLLTIQSKAEKPYVNYTVSAKASNRTADSVKVVVTITTALASSSNYFTGKRILEGSICFNNGDWHKVTLKKSGENWKGNSGHTVNLTVTVKGLEATATKLTNIKFKVERKDDLGKTGILNETACNDLEIYEYVQPVPATWYLAPSSFGSVVGKWHGPSITRTIPADASGEVGAQDYQLTFKHSMQIGSGENAKNQKGAFQVHITDSAGGHIAGMRAEKSTVDNKLKITLYVKGTAMHTETLSLAPVKGFLQAQSYISKSGNIFTFCLGQFKKGFGVAGNFNDAVKITFAFEQYSATPTLVKNGLQWVKFVKNNCDTYKNIPNKFSANDIVEADCKNGEIYLNGNLTPALGALGNDWEGFYLTPGLNQIGFACSEWVETAPTFKVRYREVFL